MPVEHRAGHVAAQLQRTCRLSLAAERKDPCRSKKHMEKLEELRAQLEAELSDASSDTATSLAGSEDLEQGAFLGGQALWLVRTDRASFSTGAGLLPDSRQLDNRGFLCLPCMACDASVSSLQMYYWSSPGS